MPQIIELDQALIIAAISFLSTAFGALVGAWASSRATRMSLEHQEKIAQESFKQREIAAKARRRFEYMSDLYGNFRQAIKDLHDSYSKSVSLSSGGQRHYIYNHVFQLVTIQIATGDQEMSDIAQKMSESTRVEDIDPLIEQAQARFAELMNELHKIE